MAASSEIVEFFDELSSITTAIEARSGDDLVLLVERISKFITTLHYLKSIHRQNSHLDELVHQFFVFYQDLYREIRYGRKENNRVAIFRSSINVEKRESPGRPKHVIPADTLVYFRNLGFTWQNIADMFHVSRWTIRRRVVEYNLDDIVGYSDMTNDELDGIITCYRNTHGLACGRSMIMGYLNSLGLKLQQRPLFESIRLVLICAGHLLSNVESIQFPRRIVSGI